MPWSDLMDLAAATNLFSLPRPPFHKDRESLDNFYHAFWNPVNRYRPHDDDPGVPLAEWLNRTRHFLASDPRDKIFALLHVAIDTRDLVQTDAQIAPDYNKSLVDVMLDYSDAGLELPFEIRKDETAEEVTSTFNFGLWIQDYLAYEKSIPLEGRASSNPVYPYRARRVALIEDPEYDLWDDAEQSDQSQQMFGTSDGRYSAAGHDIMRGNEIITCVGSDRTFIIAFISITDEGVRLYACRGTCTRLGE